MAYADTLVREFPCSGWSIDSLDVAGAPALRLRIGTSYETIVELATLRPLSTRYVTSRDSFDVRVTGPLATGWIAWGGKPLREVRDTIGESAFFGVLVEHLLGTFPLDHGYEAVVPLYAPYSGVSRDTLRVLAKDTVQVGGSAHAAWRVALIAPRANAGVRTFWVDLRTGRLLKRENSGPGGARVVQTVLLAGSASPVPTARPEATVLRSVALRVHDMQAMRAFYTEAFGARFREVDVRGLRSQFGNLNGTLTLKFVPIRDAVDFTGFPVHQLGFEVNDVQRVVDLAVRHGGRVQDPPERVEGRWQAAIRDPDGNTIELSESPGGAGGASPEGDQRAELKRLVAAVQDADYRGDLDRLRALGESLGPYAAHPALARAALYWRGFASWRRALNGANESAADLKTVEQDFAFAAREFERVVALDSTYVEARIGAAACLMSRGFLNRSVPSVALPLWRRAQEHLEVVQRDDPDNPRLLFVTAGRVFWSPPTHGGDRRRAITMVEHGLARVSRASEQADSLEPAWGEAELHMLIAFFHANSPSPDRASAERHARRAIALRPEWYYVRNILLPQIAGRSR